MRVSSERGETREHTGEKRKMRHTRFVPWIYRFVPTERVSETSREKKKERSVTRTVFEERTAATYVAAASADVEGKWL